MKNKQKEFIAYLPNTSHQTDIWHLWSYFKIKNF